MGFALVRSSRNTADGRLIILPWVLEYVEWCAEACHDTQGGPVGGQEALKGKFHIGISRWLH